ncbi:MAG: SPFH domain-containing protein [Phycisphaerales bacterium]
MTLPPDQNNPLDLPQENEPSAPRRAASITLTSRDSSAASDALSLDPAQRSLAEALRITFLLLQAGMAVLIVLFLVSGARKVNEAERGVRLTFGRIVSQDIGPGLHFSWPFPVGEFLTVQTGQQSLELKKSFWFNLSARQENLPIDKLPQSIGNVGLVPGVDGSLVTGDGNLIHAQFTVLYRRDDPSSYLKNVYTPDEETLVRVAVERAVVRVIAETPIDALLQQGASLVPAPTAPQPTETTTATEPAASADPTSPEPAPAVAAPAAPAQPDAPVLAGESLLTGRIRSIAQATLDLAQSGIRIDQIALRQLIPPIPTREAFANVQSAVAAAAKAVEDAEKESRERLNRVAGQANQILLDRIDAYEDALARKDNERAEGILADIDRLLEGQPVDIDGRRYDRVVAGEASNRISSARQYRTEIVSTSRSDVERFRAKLEQFRENPALLVSREWADAYIDFLSNPLTSVMLLPPGADLELLLNQDPQFARDLESARNKAEITATVNRIEREKARRREAWDTHGDSH